MNDCKNYYNKDAIDLSVVDKNKKIIDEARPFSVEVLTALKDDFNLRWTYHSNAIEGNTLTLAETKVVIEDGITIGGKTLREHLEAVNHIEAVKMVEELAKSNKPLTEDNIKDIHYLVLKSISTRNAGIYRSVPVFIVGATHVPPNYVKVPRLMANMVDEYNTIWQGFHPIIRASFLHSEFVKIHPFTDGNGRTSRLLMNLELIKAGYPPAIIKNEYRAQYYDSLDKAHTTGDLTDFINLVKDSCVESEQRYIDVLSN